MTTQCKKIKYESKEAAKREITLVKKITPQIKLADYYFCPSCTAWHTTSSPEGQEFCDGVYVDLFKHYTEKMYEIIKGYHQEVGELKSQNARLSRNLHNEVVKNGQLRKDDRKRKEELERMRNAMKLQKTLVTQRDLTIQQMILRLNKPKEKLTDKIKNWLKTWK